MSPVCISGMHRSGTSMVARVLHICGLDLGASEDLMSPAADNPGGFFENRRFVTLDDELLEDAGGSWDSPPANAAWVSGRFGHRRRAALGMVHSFAGHEPWGWKDPRSSLTLGFWLGVAPDLRLVAVVRNPLEVAQSLRRRDGMPLEHGLSLWWTYNSSILAATRPDQRIISRYWGFFADRRAEIVRLAEFAGLNPSPDAIGLACEAVEPESRHSDFSVEDLRRAGVQHRVIDLFERLEDEAAREPEGARR